MADIVSSPEHDNLAIELGWENRNFLARTRGDSRFSATPMGPEPTCVVS